MNVLCIDGSRWEEDMGYEPLLQDGAIYQVEKEVFGNTRSGKRVSCYKLHSIDFPSVYNIKRFIPCLHNDNANEKRKHAGSRKQAANL